MTYVPAVGHIVRSKRDNQTYRVTKVFAVRVHVMRLAWGKRMNASLDHAVWIHHPVVLDGWVLYTSESPIAHAAHGMIFGAVWHPDGRRLASVAQEGLIRVRR